MYLIDNQSTTRHCYLNLVSNNCVPLDAGLPDPAESTYTFNWYVAPNFGGTQLVVPVFHVLLFVAVPSSVVSSSVYILNTAVLAAGNVEGMLPTSDHTSAGLIIKSDTIASLGAFLFALVSDLALLNPTFFHSRSTFWVSLIAIIQPPAVISSHRHLILIPTNTWLLYESEAFWSPNVNVNPWLLYVVPSIILSPDVNAQPSEPLPPAVVFAPGVPAPAYVADAFNQH